MKSLITLTGASLAVFASLTSLTQPASAGNGYDPHYRYCVSSGVGGRFMRDIPDCAYTTMAQCRMAASGMGYCIENPGYIPPRATRRARG